MIRLAGGKCNGGCRGNDVRLAPVSFRPASVEAAAPTYRLAAGDLYTVRAYSGLGTGLFMMWYRCFRRYIVKL